MMMNLHLLELFCQVVESGSFAVTADSRYVSRSAISIQIHRLEEELGVPLLKRTEGLWRPTAAGMAVYRRGQSILGQQDRMRAELRAYQAGQLPLAVGSSPTGVLQLVARAMARFRHSRPQVLIDIDADAPRTILEKLEQDRLRLVFEWGPITRSTLNSTVLAVCPFPVVTAPTHPLAQNPGVSAAQFVEHTLYCLRHGPRTVSPIELALMDSEIYPRQIVRLPSVDSVKTIVKAGFGTTVLSRVSLAEELAMNQLTEIPVEGFRLERPLLAMWRKSRPLSTYEEDFIHSVSHVAQKYGLAAAGQHSTE